MTPTESFADKIERVVRSPLPDLTMRQTAIALTVLRAARLAERVTVRGLAAHLAVSKPVVTRAINTLTGLGIARRVADPDDGRNVFILPGPNATTWWTQLERTLVA